MLSAISSLIALGREGVTIPQNSSNTFGSAVQCTCRADYGHISRTTLGREPPVLVRHPLRCAVHQSLGKVPPSELLFSQLYVWVWRGRVPRERGRKTTRNRTEKMSPCLKLLERSQFYADQTGRGEFWSVWAQLL